MSRVRETSKTTPEPDLEAREQHGSPTVCLTEVRKSYVRGEHVEVVLRGVNFRALPGTCTFFVGPSGCGKSTLLSIIGCVLRPDGGRVELLGRDVTPLDEAARAELRRTTVGFVFQRFHLLRGLTALENVMVPLTLMGVSERLARARAAELLRLVGLDRYLDHDPRRMSVGQCQRVAIARALANDPPILLADEPTASLDAESGPKVMELLRQLAHEDGKTVLVVTHDARILHFADQIYELRNGLLSRQR